MRSISLDEDDWSLLMLMAGYASGAALKSGDRDLMHAFMRLLNKMNEGNDNYTPYGIPEKETPEPQPRDS